jgi:hypothetical protein
MVIAETASRGSVLSPIMTETFFHIPGLGPLLRALKTIPVGDLSR